MLRCKRIGTSVIFGALAVAACTTPPPGGQPIGSLPSPSSNSLGATVSPQTGSPAPVGTLADTIELEYRDRVNRFGRLARLHDVNPPEIDQLRVPAGELPGFPYAIPVVRVVFDERVFFDFDKDVVRPEAKPVLDVLADNMKHDVPDANLLVLGHTDAVGSDAYNIDLSRRRATNVIAALIQRGVNPAQLAAVAIGKRQPIAPNSTEEGRARNRRVEFMISAARAANLKLISARQIKEDYLRLAPDKPALVAPSDVEVLAPSSEVTQNHAEDTAVTMRPIGSLALQKPTTPDIQLNKPEEYERKNLGNFAL